MTNANKNEPDPQPIQPMPDARFRGDEGALFGGPVRRMAKMAQPQALGFGVQMDSMEQPEMCFASAPMCSMPMPQITIRKEFPETWLWEDFPENEYVKSEFIESFL
jgi:hypothetical protein